MSLYLNFDQFIASLLSKIIHFFQNKQKIILTSDFWMVVYSIFSQKLVRMYNYFCMAVNV